MERQHLYISLERKEDYCGSNQKPNHSILTEIKKTSLLTVREKAFEQHLLKEREVVVLMVMPNKEDYSSIPQELQPLLQKYKDL